ncbi:MAG: aldolase [Rhodocyclaceae bacterium]|nr:MAG: aldolase [Rhodocyclaceae bacterium]
MKTAGLVNGTFIKTPSPHVVEILGLSGLDFAVVDMEHAPFDRLTLDGMIFASCAVQLPLLVRIPEPTPVAILSTLDMGAAGLLVPHVDTAEQAKAIYAATRHRNGSRGFSGSPRFASYGTMDMKHSMDAGEHSFLMCQIESVQAVENAADIATVDGVDGLFIGYADLALSMGLESPQDEQVTRAAQRVIEIGLAAGKVVGMFVANTTERDKFAALGVTCFVIGSDQSLLRNAAKALTVPVAKA